MVSVSDILKILDNVPLLRRLKALPTEVDEMKARIEALEDRLAAPPVAPGRECPSCGHHAMRVTGTKKGGKFANLGVNTETWTCENCGYSKDMLDR